MAVGADLVTRQGQGTPFMPRKPNRGAENARRMNGVFLFGVPVLFVRGPDRSGGGASSDPIEVWRLEKAGHGVPCPYAEKAMRTGRARLLSPTAGLPAGSG